MIPMDSCIEDKKKKNLYLQALNYRFEVDVQM